MDPERWLDVHVHDYLIKRGFNVCPPAFKVEASVNPDFNAIDVPAGFLFELWSVFWNSTNAMITTGGDIDDAVATCLENMKALLTWAMEYQQQQGGRLEQVYLVQYYSKRCILYSTLNQSIDLSSLMVDSFPNMLFSYILSSVINSYKEVILTGISCYPELRLAEVNSIDASSSMVIACHLSADGKLLATSDHDKKAVLWHANTLEGKATLEEHTSVITDIRFGPCMTRLATSSLDKTVRVWDTNNPGSSLCRFTRHTCGVMSLDFHPIKDIVCSSDANGEIKYWSVNSGGCATVFKDCACQVRFQPLIGRFLAAATANAVLILDAETQTCYHTLKGHQEPIHTVCWDHSGELLASVSDKSVRIWTMGAGNEWSMETWNFIDNTAKRMTAQQGVIASLDASTVTAAVDLPDMEMLYSSCKLHNQSCILFSAITASYVP
ncbi:Transcriptional corepressor LEUNIG [Sesamum angolense]|uniref:Transcriptional corepressor LEUNIG n=1 Tax=Sesamum angolense TaxID=2727404 RepID=A0AAE2BX94_9LAMI|nr:Transcriptional corepressor LEUNIG [Sesamum angolense]